MAIVLSDLNVMEENGYEEHDLDYGKYISRRETRYPKRTRRYELILRGGLLNDYTTPA